MHHYRIQVYCLSKIYRNSQQVQNVYKYLNF